MTEQLSKEEIRQLRSALGELRGTLPIIRQLDQIMTPERLNGLELWLRHIGASQEDAHTMIQSMTYLTSHADRLALLADHAETLQVLAEDQEAWNRMWLIGERWGNRAKWAAALLVLGGLLYGILNGVLPR